MNKKTFYTRVDWWLWALIILATAIFVIAAIGISIWLAIAVGVLSLALLCSSIINIYYIIDGDTLIVHSGFTTQRYPIHSITYIKPVFGFLAMPAASTRRLAIRFTHRGILRSHMPLEVSPKDPEKFIAALKEINPAIEILA